MLHVLYLVHDLNDPAVRRRVIMLAAGGATVTLAGFHRDRTGAVAIEGITPIDFGLTADGKLIQRAGAVARTMLRLQHLFKRIRKPDVIVSRNLEMLAIAHRANAVFGGAIPIVYECLDIHRLLLRHDIAGAIIRRSEGYFGRRAKLIVTSSPAFIDYYFRSMSALRAPVMLVENKVIALDEPAQSSPFTRSHGPPWKIGWFGALRCRRSLKLLSDFSRALEGKFEIVLRGRPAYGAFDDFDAIVAKEPYLSFLGPYKNPEELPAIYGDVHFSWAIDFFEEGLNSSWLLPNRLYEGCLHGAVPIAVEGTETARFLARHAIGLCLREATPRGLIALFSQMDIPLFRQLRNAVISKDKERWTAVRADCVALVGKLTEISAVEPPQRRLHSLVSANVRSNGEPI
ncbi:glycosyl transferase family 1 [Rhizobium sp. BR 362]|uniref:glycosyl transferase family 1 n=1 Tax=Rhizobium sp. BR 362 TaxID=3040670 RepID=UPI002F3E9295